MLRTNHESSLPNARSVEHGVAQEVHPFIEVLIEREDWAALLSSCLEDCEGHWPAALRQLSSPVCAERDTAFEEATRCIVAACWDLGDWLLPRLERATQELTTQNNSAASEESLARVADTLAVVQGVCIVENPANIVGLVPSSASGSCTEAIASSLALLGDFVGEAMESSWSDFNQEQRIVACRVLGGTNGPWGIARLLDALDAVDSATRTAAARALSERKDSEALGELVRCLQAALLEDDPSGEDEVEALEDAILAVGMASPEVLSRLIGTLASWFVGAEESVRFGFAEILTRIDAGERSDWIEPLLTDSSPEIREIAGRSVWRLATPLSIGVRQRLLEDEAPAVRQALAVALGQTIDLEGFDVLDVLLGDEDERVRIAALRSVARRLRGVSQRVEAHRIVAWVEGALEAGGLSAMTAAEMLLALGASEAIPLVRRLISELDLEGLRAAVVSLSRHPDPLVVLELRPVLGHPHPEVRMEVADAFAERELLEAAPAILKHLEEEPDSVIRNAMLAAVKRLRG